MKLKALIISTASLLLFSATATAEIIGGGKGGCVMGPDRGFDPMFPLLVLFAVVYLIRRRVKTRVE